MRLNFQELEQETLVKLPSGGDLKKGGPKKPWIDRKTGEPYRNRDGTPKLIQGDDLEYFRLVPDKSLQGVTLDGYPAREGELDMAELLMQRWEEVFGPEPKRLNILFLGAHLKDVLRYGNQAWVAPKDGGKGFLVRDCDGSRILKERQETPNGWRMVFDPVDEQGCPKRCACLDEAGNEVEHECPLGCKAKASLTVVLPDLGIPRQFVLRTGSGNDIREIMRNLRHFDGALNTIPFRLVRTQKEVLHQQEDGTMQPVKKWLIHVELAEASGAQFLMAQQQRNFRRFTGQSGQLPGQVDVQALAPASDEPWYGEVAEGEFMDEEPPAAPVDERAFMMPSGAPPKPKPAPAKPPQVAPESAGINPVEEATSRASEVARVRVESNVSAARVRELLGEFHQREGTKNPGAPATHPGQLADDEYQALLEVIRAEASAPAECGDEPLDAGLNSDWDEV